MDHRDFNQSFSDVVDEAAGNSQCVRCRKMAVKLREDEPMCDVDELVQQIATRSMDRRDAAIEADRELDGIMLKRRGIDFRLAPVWDFALEQFRNREQVNGSVGMFIEELLANYITSGKRSSSPSLLENSELPVFYRCQIHHS